MKYLFFITLLLHFSCTDNNPHILISPDNIIQGNNIDIKITGLQPTTKYDIYLLKNNPENFPISVSKALFLSNDNGEIDIDKDESIGGDFIGKDSLGLFYMLDTMSNLPPFLMDIRKNHTFDIDKSNFSLQIIKDKKLIKQKEFSFIIKAKNVLHTRVEENKVIYDFYKGSNNKELTLILGGSEGNNDFTSYIAKILASNGFNAAAISYFGNSKQGYNLINMPIERIDTSLYLIEKTFGKATKINLIGASRGAELALLYASINPKINSVFAFAPSSVVFSSGFSPNIPAWSYKSKPIKYCTTFDDFALITDSFNRNINIEYMKKLLENCGKETEIPVENIKGNIYLFSGEEDLLMPASQMANMIEERINKSSFNKEFVNLKSPKVGHYVLKPPYLSTKNYSDKFATGGNRKNNSYANLKYWNFLLEKL